MEKSQYNTWSKIFKISVITYSIDDHIIPFSMDDTIDPYHKEIDPKLLLRIGAVILQRIYGTILDDLLNIIIQTDSMYELSWNQLLEILLTIRIQGYFVWNRNFARVQMEQFTCY